MEGRGRKGEITADDDRFEIGMRGGGVGCLAREGGRGFTLLLLVGLDGKGMEGGMREGRGRGWSEELWVTLGRGKEGKGKGKGGGG